MPKGPAGLNRPLTEPDLIIKQFRIYQPWNEDEVSEIEDRIRDEQGIRADVKSEPDEFGEDMILLIRLPTPRASLSAIHRTVEIIEDVIGKEVDDTDIVVEAE